MNPEFFLAVVMFLVGFVYGTILLGAGLLSLGALVLIYPPKDIVLALSLYFIPLNFLSVLENRSEFRKTGVKNIRLTALNVKAQLTILTSMLLGLMLFEKLVAWQITLFVGVFTVSSSAYYTFKEFRKETPLPKLLQDRVVSKTIDYSLLSFAGLVQGVIGTGGPPIMALYLLKSGFAGGGLLAGLGAFGFVVNVFRALFFLYRGYFSYPILTLSVFMLLLSTPGVAIGIKLRRRYVDAKLLRRLVILTLLVIGVSALHRALYPS